MHLLKVLQSSESLSEVEAEALKPHCCLFVCFPPFSASAEEVEKMSKKMEEVKDAKVRVVSEEFLKDVKSSSKSFQELLSLHAISPWGAEVKTEHQEVAVDGKCSKPQNMKSAGKVKEEQGEERSDCFFRALFNALCAQRKSGHSLASSFPRVL